MTCENCIHFEICNEQADGNIVELMKEPCYRFRDKDSFNVKWREWNTVPNKNGDLISRSAFLAEYDRQHEGEAGRARKLVENAPAVDAVEVVRCKDCKHCGTNHSCYYHSADDGGTPIFIRDNDFCSYGERKTDE